MDTFYVAFQIRSVFHGLESKPTECYLTGQFAGQRALRTYDKTKAKRFVNERKAVEFLQEHNLDSYTLEEVDPAQEPNRTY